MPNLFPFTSIPLYAAAEALVYIKLQASRHDVNLSFVRYFALLMALNGVVWFIFWGYIYAGYISPLRKFPVTKSSTETIASRAKMSRPPGSPFLDWIRETKNDGFIRSPLLMVNTILVTAPDTIAEVLVHRSYDFEKPQGARDVLRKALGDGLIIVEGDVHRFQRKHLMPSFAFRNIKKLYPMMWKKSLALMDHLSTEISNQTSGDDTKSSRIEIGSWASKATLDIIGVAGIGFEFDALRDSDNQLTKDFEELLKPDSMRIFHFFLSVIFGWNFASRIPLQTNYDYHRLTDSLHSISGQLVRDKRAAMAKGGEHLDILGLLITSNDFSDDQLTDQVLTFLAAGHETTSSAFTWVTYLLSTRPEIQHQLREEVRKNLPADYRTNTQDLCDILEKLPLLNGICQETLRLYPTVPVTVRTSNKDTQILGNTIPKGTNIILSPWAINRSPDLWQDAEKFVPERWITDGRPNNNGGAASNYSILTFLHGPRSCIGQGFAKAELRCLLAATILNFEWSLDMPEADVMPAGVITIKPKKGMYLKMKKIAQE